MTQIQHSPYSKTYFNDTLTVDIDIFRETEKHLWELWVVIDGEETKWQHEFIADKSAYDAAIAWLEDQGIDLVSMYDADTVETFLDTGLVQSPLSQTIEIQGHFFDIEIYRMEDEAEWTLEIVNEKATSFSPEMTFKTDTEALATALADFDNEPIEEFLE